MERTYIVLLFLGSLPGGLPESFYSTNTSVHVSLYHAQKSIDAIRPIKVFNITQIKQQFFACN
jgi:hypothetical protein